MPPPSVLIRLLCEAVLTAVHDSVLDDVVVEATPELAEAVWTGWHRQGDTAGLRAEIEVLARIATLDFEPAVHELVAEVGGKGSSAISETVGNYLTQVPAAIRRRFRRPADPSGATFPAWLTLAGPADLLGLLPPRPPALAAGDRPWEIGDWELLELLDVSGIGEVWKARNPRQQELPPAALKFCLHPEARQRLGRDAGSAAPLERVLREAVHPGLVRLRQVYHNARPPCLECEYVEGGDLAGLVRDWHAAAAPAPPQVAVLVLQMARTLGHVHRLKPPLVHRDLRPTNVLVQQARGGVLTCKIDGLGLGDLVPVRPPSDAGPRATAAAPPTLLYASPQQRGGEPPDPRDDVYALGVLWYQMLTGNLGAGRPGGSQWRRKLAEGGMGAGLIELLEACFEDDPAFRPADAAALAEQLARLLESPSPPAADRPVTAPRPVPPPERTVEAPPPPRARRARADLSQLFDTLEKSAPELAKLLTNSVGMKCVLIPAGSFLMGAAPDEAGRREGEVPQHEVAITRPFYLAVHPVTQGQYEKVMGKNPSRFHRGNGGGPEHPLESVTWEDALAFCRRLSEVPAEKEAGRSYRLPTEAEWEYACRAGTATPFCYGPALSAAQAAFDGRFPYGGGAAGPATQRTTPVGSYAPNNFGLCDMHGNVWEWCADWHDGCYYARSPKRDPQGPPEGRLRVLRGGSWRNHAATCRAAYRNALDPRARDQCSGFRVLLEVQRS